jgi:hypothetical protein
MFLPGHQVSPFLAPKGKLAPSSGPLEIPKESINPPFPFLAIDGIQVWRRAQKFGNKYSNVSQK